MVRGTVGIRHYRLRVTGEFSPKVVRFTPGTEDLVIRVERGGRVNATFLVDAKTPWARLEYKLVSRRLPEGPRDSLSRALYQARLSGRPYYNGEAVACSWTGLSPGPYRLTVVAADDPRPIVEISDIAVVGGVADDPRLFGIDLRSRTRGFTVRVIDLEGKPIRDELHGAGVVIRGAEDQSAQWRGREIENGQVHLIASAPVDLLVTAPGYVTKEVSDVFSDATVTLQPAPELRFRLVPAPPELPEGCQLELWLDSDHSQGNASPGLVLEGAGRMTFGGPASYFLGWADMRIDLDPAGEGVFQVRALVPRRLRLFVRRSTQGETRRASVELETASLDVGAIRNGQVVQLRSVPEALQKAIAEISR